MVNNFSTKISTENANVTDDKPSSTSPKPKPVRPGDDLTKVAPIATILEPDSSDATPNRFKRVLKRYWTHKRLTLPLTVLLLVGILLLVPFTRYQLLGLFLKEDFQIVVLDDSSKKPVSNAQVQLGGSTAITTDSYGRATIRTKVGTSSLSVIKKYYKTTTADVLVPVNQKNVPFKVILLATGRQVPVMVTNKVTGQAVEGAQVAAAGTAVKTGKDGKVVIVLPADKATVEVKISAKDLNTINSKLQVTEQTVKENSFQLVPNGKIYFLSRLSGKIDVVKTNLDGSERQTVLPGTGKENNTDTILLASRDWKYLALKSLRDGGANPKLFLIDTATDKLTTMDEGNAYFQAVGWADHRFVYQVGRNGVDNWTPKAQALKSYDAGSGKMVTVDETDAEGGGSYDYAFSQFSSVYIMNNELVYHKNWIASYYSSHRLSVKQVSLISVRPDGSAKKTVKEFPIPPNIVSYYIQSKLYAPQELYLQIPPNVGDKSTYYEYEHGKIEAKPNVSEQQYNDAYATYLISPSGKHSFWADERDGKNSLFVGDSEGQDGKQIASLSEYAPYGWYTDDYLFVSKNSSELYIMPVTPGAGSQPLKVSDYHKPNYNFRGYGYGYGGL